MQADKFLLAIALLSFAGAGCSATGQGGGSGSQPRRDIWYNEPRSFPEYLHVKGQLLDTGRVFEVRATYEVEAERMLDQVSFVEVDVETAKRMVGDHFRGVEGYIPFMVRGLYYSKGTGRWQIHELDDRLQVANCCLGKQGTDMHRQVLILLLKRRPRDVFIFCSASQ